MHSSFLRQVAVRTDGHLPAATDQRVAVLFVTDDSDLRAVAARVLAGAGYRVHAASHSGHALLTAMTTRVDVLVVELSGPDISGPTLAERIRREQPEVATVYLANSGTPEGLDHLLVRPFTREDLIAGIEATLSARFAASN
jgi:two-component system, cell cycle sensor histidine kinase and response regulator CckA